MSIEEFIEPIDGELIFKSEIKSRWNVIYIPILLNLWISVLIYGILQIYFPFEISKYIYAFIMFIFYNEFLYFMWRDELIENIIKITNVYFRNDSIDLEIGKNKFNVKLKDIEYFYMFNHKENFITIEFNDGCEFTKIINSNKIENLISNKKSFIILRYNIKMINYLNFKIIEEKTKYRLPISDLIFSIAFAAASFPPRPKARPPAITSIATRPSKMILTY